MQAYRGLPVLTNQPAAGELARVPHHLVGIWPLEHAGSVAEFGELARAAVDGVLERGRVPILAGGTGLYLRAALAELPLPPAVPESVRRHYGALYDREGARAAHAVSQSAIPARRCGSIPTTAAAWGALWSWREAGQSLVGARRPVVG